MVSFNTEVCEAVEMQMPMLASNTNAIEASIPMSTYCGACVIASLHGMLAWLSSERHGIWILRELTALPESSTSFGSGWHLDLKRATSLACRWLEQNESWTVLASR